MAQHLYICQIPNVGYQTRLVSLMVVSAPDILCTWSSARFSLMLVWTGSSESPLTMRLKGEAILTQVNNIISLVSLLIYITRHFSSYSAENTIAIGKTNYLLLFREVTGIYCKNHTDILTINILIEKVQNLFY
jgi:hypothetical protein